MSHELVELPLFPLHTVLFPYAQIQLNVFEERYRHLVRDCVEFNRPLGIVLIRPGSEAGGTADPYMVGTAVRILNSETHSDGTMDIQVFGESRFRIRKLDESRDYLVGYVEPVVELEIEDSPRVDALVIRVRESFRLLLEGILSRQDLKVQVQFPSDPVALSFTVANVLQMENLQKQRLLELTDTTERFSTLLPILEQQAEALEQTVYYRLGRAELSEWIHPN
jgi:Lon protease-like protein